MNDLSDQTKLLVDAFSLSTLLMALIQFLPAIAALFTIIWTLIRIWETKTVQKLYTKWFCYRKSKHHRRDDIPNALDKVNEHTD